MCKSVHVGVNPTAAFVIGGTVLNFVVFWACLLCGFCGAVWGAFKFVEKITTSWPADDEFFWKNFTILLIWLMCGISVLVYCHTSGTVEMTTYPQTRVLVVIGWPILFFVDMYRVLCVQFVAAEQLNTIK